MYHFKTQYEYECFLGVDLPPKTSHLIQAKIRLAHKMKLLRVGWRFTIENGYVILATPPPTTKDIQP